MSHQVFLFTFLQQMGVVLEEVMVSKEDHERGRGLERVMTHNNGA